MSLSVELRMHTRLISGFHAKGVFCPEVFRGRYETWISCSHPDHLVEPEQYRRRRLLDQVIPKLMSEIADVERNLMESEESAVQPAVAQPAETPPVSSEPRRSRTPRLCVCGCNEMTKGGRFRPGHDARLHSTLVNTVTDIESRLDTRQDALRRLETLNWGDAVPDHVREGLKDGYE